MTSSDQPMDHVPPSAEDSRDEEKSEFERNVKSRSTWLRLVFMILFAVLYGLSRVVTAAVVVVQFFHVLLTGDTNEQLKTFGHSLAIYSYQVVEYLTFNSETRPYPLDASWPDTLADLSEGDPA
jgi:hypothetical protein